MGQALLPAATAVWLGEAAVTVLLAPLERVVVANRLAVLTALPTVLSLSQAVRALAEPGAGFRAFAVASRANVFLRITPARARGPSAADDDNHLPADDGEAAAAAAAGAAAAASAATAHGEQDGSEPGGPLLDTAAPPEPLLLDGGDQADGAAADQTAEAPAADTPATAATETTAGTLLDAVDVSVELLQLVEDGARGEEEAAAGGQDAAEK